MTIPVALQELMQQEDLCALQHILQNYAPCHLVGGSIRDALLGRPSRDLDLVLAGDPTQLARDFAELRQGTWVPLDPVRRQHRVVIKRKGLIHTFDFSPLRAPTLQQDLRLRDFTINAMAIPLGAASKSVELIDPLGGWSDLLGGHLRVCSPDVLLHDPLRVFKGVRHCLSLGLEALPETLKKMAQAVHLLPQVAPERIRGEVGEIFHVEDLGDHFELLRDAGILPVLWDRPISPTMLQHCRDAVLQVEAGLKHLADGSGAEAIATLLEEELEERLTRRALLKMAAFFGVGPSVGSEQLARRWRLGRRSVRALGGYMQSTPELAAGLAALRCQERGLALWVAKLPGDALGSLLGLSRWYHDGALTRELIGRALQAYLAHQVEGRVAPLVDGRWIQEHCQLVSGPQVGLLQEALADAEIRGQVENLEEARKFLISLKKKTFDNLADGSYNLRLDKRE
ncbi:hypothetical protein [Desulfuromonas sp. CSMB_57]|uniref:hypothetical protein n=1 Tax=Desulfuromonas sp. CSMB_57 TaxID=2807629 RepID=UPI001CD6C19A|nr:hypothetical protein [Desulfuromonas sp. CSMB_57]